MTAASRESSCTAIPALAVVTRFSQPEDVHIRSRGGGESFDHRCRFFNKEYVMSIKAILTTLILGSSTAALAAPAARDHRIEHAPAARNPGVRDHREIAHRDFGGRPSFQRE